MKAIIAITLLGACLVSNTALAQSMNADDLKGEAGATPAIIRAHCICMNEKMDNNETQSITQWEKSHPNERRACDKQAGWR